MSDSILRYVPTDPFFTPAADDASAAISVLGSIAPKAEQISHIFEEKVVFYNPGENWSGVRCSSCGADAEPWWDDAMNAAFATDFENLDVVAGCCGAHLSLNNLSYVWPAAFGRFALEVLNPHIPDTTEEQDLQVVRALGTSLRKMWVRL